MYSVEADITTLAPVADFVGATFKGALTYGQLAAAGGGPTGTGLSINQLLEIAGDAECKHSTFLRGAVCNNDLVY